MNPELNELVRKLQREVGDQLQNELNRRRNMGEEGFEAADEQQYVWSLIHQLIREDAAARLAQGAEVLSAEVETEVAEAIHARMYGAGRLQQLLDDEQVENIDINSFDEVFITTADGVTYQADPVASSDEELLELIQTLASYAGLSSRPFDSANPQVDLRLPDGSRLSGLQEVTRHPAISIRRHRLTKVTLGDLVGNETLTEELADFLGAAVRARLNIMIAGSTNAGKALALDTPVPTPHGWTTMGALNAGDIVFDNHGRPSTVLMAHPVQRGRPCFEVEFSTGDVLVADADHLWEVSSRADRARQVVARKNGPRPVYTPDELALLDLVERANGEPDQDLTVRALIEEAGHPWRHTIPAIARTMEPSGATLETFSWRDSRPNARGVIRRPVATYSRQSVLKELASRRVRGARPPQVSQVRSTVELLEAMQVKSSGSEYRYNNWQVRVADALQYPHADLPIDPYVFGVWLGDGTTSAGEITTADTWVVEEFERLGYPCHRKSVDDPYRYAVQGDLQTKLRLLDVLGDKHIPHSFLRADVEQRRALLQGLLDSDGTTGAGGSVVFEVMHQLLAEQVYELACSLGYCANLNSRDATFRGRKVGTRWSVAFTTEERVFRLPRKHAAHTERTRTGSQAKARRRGRTIVDIRPVESVPVRCITVDSPSSLYLAGRAAIPTHNTTLLRAMASEIHPDERIITIEKALELGLKADGDKHPNIVEMEERIANSEGRGAVSMPELVRRTLRMNPDRVIVGEVLGDEVITMLNAMGQGNDGSLSTIHARSARDVFNRVATYALQSAERLPHEASWSLIAGGLDLVVFVRRDPRTGQRRVDSVLEVNGWDSQVGVDSSELFAAPGPGEVAQRNREVVTSRRDQLDAAGWQEAGEGWGGGF